MAPKTRDQKQLIRTPSHRVIVLRLFDIDDTVESTTIEERRGPSPYALAANGALGNRAILAILLPIAGSPQSGTSPATAREASFVTLG